MKLIRYSVAFGAVLLQCLIIALLYHLFVINLPQEGGMLNILFMLTGYVWFLLFYILSTALLLLTLVISANRSKHEEIREGLSMGVIGNIIIFLAMLFSGLG